MKQKFKKNSKKIPKKGPKIWIWFRENRWRNRGLSFNDRRIDDVIHFTSFKTQFFLQNRNSGQKWFGGFGGLTISHKNIRQCFRWLSRAPIGDLNCQPFIGFGVGSHTFSYCGIAIGNGRLLLCPIQSRNFLLFNAKRIQVSRHSPKTVSLQLISK